MSFIGRTYARLRNIQRRAKLRIDAVELVIKDSVICIFLDGVLLLEAIRQTKIGDDWSIALTDKLNNLLTA